MIHGTSNDQLELTVLTQQSVLSPDILTKIFQNLGHLIKP